MFLDKGINDMNSVITYPYKVNSYLRDIAKIPLYSEGNIPVAETEDDLASKSVPDENPMGVGLIPKSIEGATVKRKDSLEGDFDIITEDELEEAKYYAERRFTGYAPDHVYNGAYPSAGYVDEQSQNNYPRLLSPQFNQPSGSFVPQPTRAIPTAENWAYGKPLLRSVFQAPGNIISRMR